MNIEPLELNLEDLPKEFEVEMPDGTDAAHIQALRKSISAQLLYNTRDIEEAPKAITVEILQTKPNAVVVRVLLAA